MAKYIEKNEAQKRIASIATLAKSDAQEALMGRVLYCIDHIPAADVATVRHGRWLSWDELHGGNTLAKNVLGVFCSKCIRQSDSKTHFCPNCGARMDLKEEERNG